MSWLKENRPLRPSIIRSSSEPSPHRFIGIHVDRLAELRAHFKEKKHSQEENEAAELALCKLDVGPVALARQITGPENAEPVHVLHVVQNLSKEILSRDEKDMGPAARSAFLAEAKSFITNVNQTLEKRQEYKANAYKLLNIKQTKDERLIAPAPNAEASPVVTTPPEVKKQPSASDEDIFECEMCGEDEKAQILVLACSHKYCLECIVGQLKAGSSGVRITFNYMNCAFCRQEFALPPEPPLECDGYIYIYTICIPFLTCVNAYINVSLAVLTLFC